MSSRVVADRFTLTNFMYARTTSSGSPAIISLPLSIHIASVAHLLDAAQTVADQEHRPGALPQLGHLGVGLLAERGVTGGQRLVDHQDVRLHVHGHREADPG